MKKRLAFLGFTAATLLVACGEDLPDLEEGTTEEIEETDEQFELDESDTDTLFIGMTNAPDSFNPLYSPGIAGKWIQRYLYDSLLVMPDPETFEPALAASFDTEDNQTFTIEIDEDAYWTDGEPVTAHDVAFTLNAIANPDIQSNLNSRVVLIEGTDEGGSLVEGTDELSGVEVIDDKTLSFTTKEPVDIALVQESIGFDILIAPEHIFGEFEGEELASSAPATTPEVTSGPYQFETYEEDDYVHLTANADYYRGAPQIETIYGRILNGAVMITEFQAGNLHMAAGGTIGIVPHQDIPLLEDVEGLVVEEYPSLTGQYVIINNERFADPQVRRAILQATNRELLVDNLLEGRGEVLAAPYTSSNPYKHETLEPLEYDPELAVELLEDAGFDFDQEIELSVPTGNATREQAGELIHQWLTDIGLNVRMENYDFPTWLEMANNRDYDMGMMGWGHRIDPDIANYISGSNAATIEDETVDQLLAEGLNGTNFDERYPYYAELQEYIQENALVLPLYAESQYSIQVEELNGGIQEYWQGSLANVHEWTLDPIE
jgi:peptide/nickel transport system substrate-binding protein